MTLAAACYYAPHKIRLNVVRGFGANSDERESHKRPGDLGIYEAETAAEGRPGLNRMRSLASPAFC